MPPFLHLQHVNVARGDTIVLHDINLMIQPGEHIAILGPNGCGKSTLIKTITCECYPIASPDTRVSIFGRERWDLAELKKRLGVVSPELPGKPTLYTTGRDAVLTGFFSSSTLWPNLSVTPEMHTRADQVIERIGATDLIHKAVGQMSAGQQRRIMIGRALVGSIGAGKSTSPKSEKPSLTQAVKSDSTDPGNWNFNDPGNWNSNDPGMLNSIDTGESTPAEPERPSSARAGKSTCNDSERPTSNNSERPTPTDSEKPTAAGPGKLASTRSIHIPSAGMLLLDEPSNALDLAAQRDLRNLLRELAQQGTGILLITHHIADIIPEIDRILMMRSGRIYADGPKSELLTAPHLSNLFQTEVNLTTHHGFHHAW